MMFLLGKLKVYAALIGAAMLAVVTVYYRGRADGRDDLEHEITDKRLEDLLTAKEIEDEIEVLDDSGLSDRAAKWVRNPPK
jgi:hypothetical protein